MVVFVESNRRYINMNKLAAGRNNRLIPCGSVAKAKKSFHCQASTILLHFGVNDVEQTQDQQKITSDFIKYVR